MSKNQRRNCIKFYLRLHKYILFITLITVQNNGEYHLMLQSNNGHKTSRWLEISFLNVLILSFYFSPCVIFISLHTNSPLEQFYFDLFLPVPRFLTVQSKLAPCPANVNKSSDYFECILATSSVTLKKSNTK